MPQDILKAIAVAIRSNNERESAKNEENMRKERMMRTVEKIEQENTMQVCNAESNSTAKKNILAFVELQSLLVKFCKASKL